MALLRMGGQLRGCAAARRAREQAARSSSGAAPRGLTLSRAKAQGPRCEEVPV